jgi:ribosome biogenesis GTPase
MDSLEALGWNEQRADDWQEVIEIAPYLIQGRVVADFGTSLRVAVPEIITAELSGKLAHYSDPQAIPKVGDWVGLHLTDNNAVVETVLSRTGEIARAAAGNKTVKQVIAAGVDVAFIILALDNDFSVDRLRRYLYQLSVNSIESVIILNKADKTDDLDSYISQLESFKVPILVTIANEDKGIDQILLHIPAGKTAILLGSSGVGKSTMTNQLLGDARQKTAAVRESDDTGKHTTVHRELFMLPNGGLLIDTPGIRELKLWGTEEDLDENFDDVTTLISQCKYSSCQHGTEEGCAVQAALKNGSLDPKHYAAYIKLKGELVDLKTRNIAKSKADSAYAKKRSVAKQGRKLFKEERDQF